MLMYFADFKLELIFKLKLHKIHTIYVYIQSFQKHITKHASVSDNRIQKKFLRIVFIFKISSLIPNELLVH